ncbi:zinc-ribbon domain-containing protein [uncultured Lactobacillus sp.]|uniref:TcaA second domain-containing protein n=1 Tax=uncultured Lactobacillus sp. TaxID=153152 RepID=UPI0025F6BE95|nr:zinc-ribbon domain-containing protein [uncultured Lactobacillus sp.]
MVFCAKCGAKNKAGDQYCANCGAKLIKQSKLKQPMQQTKPLRQAKPYKKRVDVKKSRHGKIAAVIVVVALLILAAGYGFGKSYYAKDKQIDRIISALKDPSQDLSPYVKTDDSSFQLTKKSVQPLQTYYKENKTTANNLGSKWKNQEELDASFKKSVSLGEDGHYFFLFPRYKLMVKTYSPTVVTNHANSTIKMNGKNVGKLSASGDYYQKKLDPVIAGRYTFSVSANLSGKTISPSPVKLDLFSNHRVSLNITTGSFTVSSVPNGEVYINDKKVADLNGKGQASFKDYQITSGMSLYVKKSGIGKSDTIDNFDQYVTTPADQENDSDDDYDDDDDDSQSSDQIKVVNGSWVLTPSWPGLASTEDAEDLLRDIWDDNDSKDWVNGSSNSGYLSIKKLHDNWDDSDSVSDYDEVVKVLSTSPAGGGKTYVNYTVTHNLSYTDDKDDTSVTDTYQKGIISQDSDGDYVLEKLGTPNAK